MNSKKQYGQFYTTNVEYILDGFNKPSTNNLIEPFVGSGEILKWAEINETYDIDPKISNVKQQDTLTNPPDYNNKFVITNPPYLLRNKNKDKTLYEKYKTDDLYKVFIKTIVDGNIDGGILILPLNFICSSDHKIRNYLLSRYNITKMNVFEETVFNDTDIPICAFQFNRGGGTQSFDITFYPSRKKITVEINANDKWMVGGHLHRPVKSEFKIGRLLKGQTPTTTLFLYATDTGSMDGRIRLEQKKPFYGKETDRNFATITSNFPILDEPFVVKEFNERLEKYRDKYNSLFLTNFRNSTKLYTRKRIQFKLAFNIIKKILNDHNFS